MNLLLWDNNYAAEGIGTVCEVSWKRGGQKALQPLTWVMFTSKTKANSMVDIEPD